MAGGGFEGGESGGEGNVKERPRWERVKTVVSR